MTRIKSVPLYPQQWEPMFKTDPPKDCAVASRKNENGYQVIKEEWPVVSIGEELEIETTNHYIWRAILQEIRDADTWVVRPVVLRKEKINSWDREETPIYDKVPMPLPPIVGGQPYNLPYMSGDAWSVRPEAGKVLQICGQFYKVKGKPKPSLVGSGYEYQFVPVTAEVHAKRPGRAAIKDMTDPNPSSHTYYGHNVGRVIEIKNEWLHVTKVDRVAYGSGEGDQIFGYSTYGVGHFVPATKAAKLKAAWEAKEKVRSLELDLKVAQQDIDYGGNPDAVPGLKEKLAAAKKAAGL